MNPPDPPGPDTNTPDARRAPDPEEPPRAYPGGVVVALRVFALIGILTAVPYIVLVINLLPGVFVMGPMLMILIGVPGGIAIAAMLGAASVFRQTRPGQPARAATLVPGLVGIALPLVGAILLSLAYLGLSVHTARGIDAARARRLFLVSLVYLPEDPIATEMKGSLREVVAAQDAFQRATGRLAMRIESLDLAPPANPAISVGMVWTEGGYRAIARTDDPPMECELQYRDGQASEPTCTHQH